MLVSHTIRSFVVSTAIVWCATGCGPSDDGGSPEVSSQSDANSAASDASVSGPIDSATVDRYFAVMKAVRAKTNATGNESTDLQNWQEAMGAGEFYRETLESNGFNDASFAYVNQRVMEAIAVLRMRGQVDFDAMERAMVQASSGLSQEQRDEMKKSLAESKARMREMEAADPALVEELAKRKTEVDSLFGS